MRKEKVAFECSEVKLHGELYIPDETPTSGVIVCHGMNKNGFHGLKLYRKFAEKACEEGFVSLIFDFRGCGRSTGSFGYGIEEQKDVKCAIDYLASRKEVIPDKIFVVGHSLGGAISLYAVQNDERVKGLVLWSTPANHAYNVKKFITMNRGKLSYYLFILASYLDNLIDVSKLVNLRVFGILLRPSLVRKKMMKLNECEVVQKLKIPILIVIGDRDKIVSVEEAKQVFKAANNPKNFVLIVGANHIYHEKEHEVAVETLNWIKSYFKHLNNLT